MKVEPHMPRKLEGGSMLFLYKNDSASQSRSSQRQYMRNRNRPAITNLWGSRFLWHWNNIGQSPTCWKTTPSNQVPENYSQLRCQLPSYLLVKKRKLTILIVSTIKPSLQEALKMHDAALQLYGTHVVFTCCTRSFIHFSISANVRNKTDMLSFHNNPERHTVIK